MRVILQVVKFRSGLSPDDVRRTIGERAPAYEALPGLLQKLYIRDPRTGDYGGVYLWDDGTSLQEFRRSELGRSIGEAYRVEGRPRKETFEVMAVLRAAEGLAVTR
jgi:Putative mono-oxygenase ydhR